MLACSLLAMRGSLLPSTVQEIVNSPDCLCMDSAIEGLHKIGAAQQTKVAQFVARLVTPAEELEEVVAEMSSAVS